MIKTHPQVAYNILKPVTLPGNTATIILQHHERLNGSGYPQGLRGEEILLEARILGVADVMEAMCSHRPYRPSLGLAETLDELTMNQGVLYDANVVAACLKLYSQCLPDPQVVDRDATPLGARPALPDSQSDGAQGRAVPQTIAAKVRNWAKLRPKVNRSWMHLGSAALLGWLMMASIRGF